MGNLSHQPVSSQACQRGVLSAITMALPPKAPMALQDGLQTQCIRTVSDIKGFTEALLHLKLMSHPASENRQFNMKLIN